MALLVLEALILLGDISCSIVKAPYRSFLDMNWMVSKKGRDPSMMKLMVGAVPSLCHHIQETEIG